MNNLTFTDNNGVKYRRITKASARNAFIDGKTIVLCPSNLRPFSLWQCETKINLNDDIIKLNQDNKTPSQLFDYIVINFLYYNCVNSETGRNASYYIAV